MVSALSRQQPVASPLLKSHTHTERGVSQEHKGGGTASAGGGETTVLQHHGTSNEVDGRLMSMLLQGFMGYRGYRM